MSKNHDAIPVPDVEVYARPVGKIQFTCPNCSQVHPLKPVHWRRADLHCQRCHTKFQLGLGFSTTATSSSLLMGKWNSYTANRIDPVGTHSDSTKVYGTIEFQCPACLHPQKGFCAHDGQLSCESCSAVYFISALLYRLPKVSRLKLKAPFDSIVKGLNPHEVPTPIQSTSTETPHPRPGAPSRRPRGDR